MKPAIELINPDDCAGCYGCYNGCLYNAIDLCLNTEGYLIPNINYKKCVECGVCQRYCPILNEQTITDILNPVSYAAWSKNEDTRINSSSGGVFGEICKVFIEDGGAVFGVRFDTSFTAKHVLIEETEDVDLIRGSKYIQSHVDDSYKKAISIALKGKSVLFSGTPCQIAALNLFIRDNPEIGIFTCEVVCHGVSSELVFKSYLKYLSDLYKSEAKDYNFRDKTLGWEKYGTKIIFKNGEEYFKVHNKDPFMIGYLRNIFLRPICYKCPFATIPRSSDITLGDYWGAPQGINDTRGVSVVIINTMKGEKLFNKIKNIEKKRVSFDKITPYNSRLIDGVAEINPYRKEFFKLVKTKEFREVINRYLKQYSLIEKGMLIVNKFIRKFKNAILK